MGCLKPAHIDHEKPLLKCVWKSCEAEKNRVRMYDYGARFYDPSLGRWHEVDPLVEKYINQTPSNYCLNNPAKYVDFDGMDAQAPNPFWTAITLLWNSENGGVYNFTSNTGSYFSSSYQAMQFGIAYITYHDAWANSSALNAGDAWSRRNSYIFLAANPIRHSGNPINLSLLGIKPASIAEEIPRVRETQTPILTPELPELNESLEYDTRDLNLAVESNVAQPEGYELSNLASKVTKISSVVSLSGNAVEYVLMSTILGSDISYCFSSSKFFVYSAKFVKPIANGAAGIGFVADLLMSYTGQQTWIETGANTTVTGVSVAIGGLPGMVIQANYHASKAYLKTIMKHPEWVLPSGFRR